MNSSQTPSLPTPAPSDVDQARELFRELGSLAGTAMRMTRDGILSTDVDDLDGLRTRMEVLRLVVDRIGWISDVGLRKLGESGAFASAEDWMLPGA
ncbi:hypothetical protein GT347_12565 [Xylophilus rhododendri]|uniref:Uncharacterized protein n=1 Tax=Xylophilus rhododendri TaxID=2697032 RepID=A0A857J7K2_9BURK|nr:hypothetical protein [Xylophilus rhododendri]QHI98748.1 hypothetical protein GT347_12565 [Xylophilus rhododendri]